MISTSAQETKQIAADLLKKLRGKHILALYGELGSGKTTFIQGLAEELGIKERVLSPTFVLQRSYSVNNPSLKTFHHFDLYRVGNLEAIKSIGIEETLSQENSLIAIEWPEFIEEKLPSNTLKVKFKRLNETQREIEIS